MAKIFKMFRVEYNLENYYQLREAASLPYLLASEGFNGSLAQLFCSAELPHGWNPKIDLRTKEGREFKEAEKAMFEALSNYDKARKACFKKEL